MIVFRMALLKCHQGRPIKEVIQVRCSHITQYSIEVINRRPRSNDHTPSTEDRGGATTTHHQQKTEEELQRYAINRRRWIITLLCSRQKKSSRKKARWEMFFYSHYIKEGKYPNRFSKPHKQALRKRAKFFIIKDTQLYYIGGDKLNYNYMELECQFT